MFSLQASEKSLQGIELAILPRTPALDRSILYRTARTIAQITVRTLATEAEVSTNTITRLEAGDELKPSTVARIRTVLESHGVTFVPDQGDGEWVIRQR